MKKRRYIAGAYEDCPALETRADLDAVQDEKGPQRVAIPKSRSDDAFAQIDIGFPIDRDSPSHYFLW